MGQQEQFDDVGLNVPDWLSGQWPGSMSWVGEGCDL